MIDETSSEQWLDGGDITLEQAIEEGTIVKPSRLKWQDWQKWRKNPFGGRRATKNGGSTRPTTTQEESKLWQSTMLKLYGSDWLADLHGEEGEEEPVQEEKEEGPQVAPSTQDGLPPGLEQVAPSTQVPGPPLSVPKTPPAFRRSLSPLRAAKATPSSVGTGRSLTQDSAARTLEASPLQKLKDLKAGFPPTHRGPGFLDASKGATWKAIPAFPLGDVPASKGALGRRASEPSLPLQPEPDEDSGEEPSPMPKTRMICRCCGTKNTPEADVCSNCNEEMYNDPEGDWEEDWGSEDWNEGDAWYNDNEGADGDSAYTGGTADSSRMPLDRARMEFQDDWEPNHETKDDFETRIQRATRTLEAHNELNPVAYSRVIIRANYLEQALMAMKPDDPYENAPAIMFLIKKHTRT